MKFFLTVFICSVLDGKCIVPMQDPYNYPKIYDTHYECVKDGLSQSFEILFAEKFFDQKSINTVELYPKYTCQKVPVAESPA